MEKPVVVGGMGPDFAEPPHRGPVELELVDRLTGADVPQLRRSVGAERDQRDRRVVGLADGRVEVRRGGAGGAEDRDRACRSPGRRRARSRRPSARRRSPSPRSPAGARARPPAASIASRARGPRSASRIAPAPRRRRTRARCWRSSGPRLWNLRGPRAGVPRARPRRSRPRDPAPPAGGASRRPARSRPRRSSTANRRWVASPCARSRPSSPLLAQRLGDLRRGRDPDRPVEGAGDVGRDHLGDLDRRLRAADLRELDPGQRPCAHRDGALGLGPAGDALVGGDRNRGRRRDLDRLLGARDRLLGELEVELLEAAERPLRGLDVPGAVGIDPDPGLRPDAPRGRPAPGRGRRRPRASA